SRRFYRMPRPGRDRDAVCQPRANMTTIERDGNVAKVESDYGSSTAKHTKAKSRTEYMSARGSISTKVTLNMYLMSYEQGCSYKTGAGRSCDMDMAKGFMTIMAKKFGKIKSPGEYCCDQTLMGPL